MLFHKASLWASKVHAVCVAEEQNSGQSLHHCLKDLQTAFCAQHLTINTQLNWSFIGKQRQEDIKQLEVT